MNGHARPHLYGAAYSVYVRIVRLVLAEKGVDHDLTEVDVFADSGPPDWYLRLYPFGRIPAFVHADLTLYETAAITRYIDDAFAGPALQPEKAAEHARMNQIVAVLDAYAYRPMVWDVYVEAVEKPGRGEHTDEAVVAGGLAASATVLAALDGLKSPGPWLLGAQLTLADLHAAPMFDYFVRSTDGARLLAQKPRLAAWWANLAKRPSALAALGQ
ncbi:MAG: glutathione S-transferase family protein [Phyllobacteriaceae bacterium]|nr:glutathione S-transferase family protein [Phyllobacteriaceae bacterium]